MGSKHVTETRNGKRKLLAIGATAIAVLAVSAGAMSLALFTDDTDMDNNAFTSGTIVLTTNPTTALFTVPNMMPGDTTYGQLTVTNGGTGALRYAMTSTSTNADTLDLRDVVMLEIREKAAGTCAADFTGAVVMASDDLASAAFGSVAQGAQGGDRPLAVSGSEDLCFQANLPGGTGNAYQGATTTTTFTFHAEQTANN